MSTKALTRNGDYFPSMFEDFFKPWNEWYPSKSMFSNALSLPAVNIAESKDEYSLSLAVPGMKKEDFKVDVEGNLLTISSEKEENKEEKDEKYSRKEYNYSSFSRSFTLPEVIQRDKIDAKYENGILKIQLPKKEESVKIPLNKLIEVK